MNLLEGIIETIAGYADMLVLILFFEVMFSELKKWATSLRYWSINVFGYGICILCSSLEIFGEVESFVWIVFTFALSLLYQGSIVWHIVSVFIFQVIAMIAEVLTVGIYTIILQREIAFSENVMLGNTMMASSKLFLFILVVIISIFYRKKKKEKNIPKSYQIAMLMIALLSVSGILLQVKFNNSASALSGMNPATYMISFLLLFINLFMYILLNQVIENVENKKEKEKMQLLMQLQEEKYDEISESFRQIKKVIHDTRKHFHYIQRGIEEQSYEEVNSYIEKVDSHLTKQYEKVHTGNLAVDAMINNGFRQAEQEDVKMESDIRIYKKEIGIEKYDLCTIIGNLIDNAIEGANRTEDRDARYVKIRLYTEEYGLIIETENGITKGVEIDFQKSSKANKKNHGFGMQNISETVYSYGGNINTVQKEDYVRIVVYVPYRQEKVVGKEDKS